jgi:DNA polymerase III epsilon subunit-like protein
MKDPRKILLIDLETSHDLLAKFGLYPEYTNPENIIKGASIICAAWKWLDKKEIYSANVADHPKAFAKDRNNDKNVVLELKKAMEIADVVVAHNGDKFDIKWFNTRCLYHGIDEIAPPFTVDTLKIAKKHYRFSSNKLDYLGKYLGVGRKIKTHNHWWLAIVDVSVPVKEAIKLAKKMEAYNKMDVMLLERVFKKLRHRCIMPNANLFHDTPIALCPNCGSEHLIRHGNYTNKSGRYQRLKCQDCGTWSMERKSLQTTTIK